MARSVCGNAGALLTGSGRPGEPFVRIDAGTTRTLLALRTVRGQLYALAATGLLRIGPAGVVPVATPELPKAIDTCDDALWIATNDTLFISHDSEHFTPCT